MPRIVCGGIPASSNASHGDFEQQPLLRVHRRRLPWGDREELRVELVGLPRGEEAPFAVADRSRHGVVVGVVGVGVPAFGRNPDDAAAAVVQQLPILFGVVHPAGKPAPHADHGDRFGACLFGDLQARRQIVDLVQRVGDDRPAIRCCGGHLRSAQPFRKLLQQLVLGEVVVGVGDLLVGTLDQLGKNRGQIVGEASTVG